MKKKSLLRICLFFTVLTGCGEDGIADLFIPNFTNNWTSSRETPFEFKPNATDVSEGSFTGTEDNGIRNDFEGSFNNLDIEFTFLEGDEAGVNYSGKFIKDSKPLTMKVKGTNNVELTIIKNE